MLRIFNWDEVRHAIERVPPQHHLAASYYERIIVGVAGLFVEKGVVTHAELERRAGGRFLLARPVAPPVSLTDAAAHGLPLRPPETQGWSEKELAAIVTREAMIDVAPVLAKSGTTD